MGHDVKVKSAQDLWDLYEVNHKGADRKNIDVYTAAEYFVEQHSNGHYVVDECPFKADQGNGKSNRCDLRKNSLLKFNLGLILVGFTSTTGILIPPFDLYTIIIIVP